MTSHLRIFVQIASYRDKECQTTVRDMFEKATYPERIFAGICWQFIPEEDAALFQIITRPDQVRVNLVNAKQSQGACWARRMTQTLWQGEEYTLQIDSHMRFEPGWDETMLGMIALCDSPKSVLTTYPPGYEPPDKIHGRWATALCASHFDSGGVFMPKAISFGEDTIIEKPMKGALLSGNFFFARSEFIREVPYDPYLYFIGEEITLAVRAWTHGWDLYYPNKPVIYHNYTDAERTGRKTHFTDNSEWWKLNDLSYKRVKHILGTEISTDPDVLKELDIYGLGTARSLLDYQDYSGINFKAKSFTESASNGIFGVANPIDKTDRPKIFVQIAAYRDPECQHTVKDLFEKAAYPERINVGICWQFIRGVDDDLFEVAYPRPRQVKVIEVDSRETKGACWARALTQKLWTGEEYMLQLDSHMRFEPGWDESLIRMLDQCDSPKPILSTYPNGYNPPNIIPHKFPTILHADKFDDDGILIFLAKGVHEEPKPVPGAFLSGNYLFTKSTFISEVPYDPYLYFRGEEIALAVRAWTHGWDIFNPNKPIIYHRWERDGRKTVFEDNTKWWEANSISLKRIRHILDIETSTDKEVIKELNIYGLGKTRSLAAYEQYSGVDFKTPTLTEKAKNGVYSLQSSAKRSNAKKSKAVAKNIDVPIDQTDPKAVFTKIFQTNKWACDETVSGHGSVKHWSDIMARQLETLMAKLKVKTLADVPCGDGNFISCVELGDIKYTGYDIVEDLVKMCKKRFKDNDNMTFKYADALTDVIKRADLIFCRDMLLHFPNDKIFESLKNFKKSGSKWLLVSHSIDEPHGWQEQVNKDIAFGEFRPVNLTMPPFNFKPPKEILLEGFPYRGMALWDLTKLDL